MWCRSTKQRKAAQRRRRMYPLWRWVRGWLDDPNCCGLGPEIEDMINHTFRFLESQRNKLTDTKG
jgi:hypothetical protein